MSTPDFVVTDQLLERLAVPGPRYTSYPTAPEWSDEFKEAHALDAYREASLRPDEPLSVYVHLPFCERLCLYCGCTVEIIQEHRRADRYLDAIARELELVASVLGPRRKVAQLHWGGGTPTFLELDQLERLHALLKDVFEFEPSAEQSIEVDPHVTTSEQIDLLATLGFNRVSLGVQDLDQHVQKVVYRNQTVDETVQLVNRCRARGMDHINVDLMYGLPGQTVEGFGRTLDLMVELQPDRLAVFGYAHVPWLKPAQRALETIGLPAPSERCNLFGLALNRLVSAGYEVIGLDHFARPDDALCAALRNKTLYRNFMGYTTQAGHDLVGIGMSAIGDVAGRFVQNARQTKAYEEQLSQGHLATIRGLQRSPEDELRRSVILSLMCRMTVDLDELERETSRTDLAEHFSREWRDLERFAGEGFCELSPRRITVTPTGRLFLRHLAMVFDAYLQERKPAPPRFSQAV